MDRCKTTGRPAWKCHCPACGAARQELRRETKLPFAFNQYEMARFLSAFVGELITPETHAIKVRTEQGSGGGRIYLISVSGIEGTWTTPTLDLVENLKMLIKARFDRDVEEVPHPGKAAVIAATTRSWLPPGAASAPVHDFIVFHDNVKDYYEIGWKGDLSRWCTLPGQAVAGPPSHPNMRCTFRPEVDEALKEELLHGTWKVSEPPQEVDFDGSWPVHVNGIELRFLMEGNQLWLYLPSAGHRYNLGRRP